MAFVPRPDNRLYVVKEPQQIGDVATLIEYKLDIGSLSELQFKIKQGYYQDATQHQAMTAELDRIYDDSMYSTFLLYTFLYLLVHYPTTLTKTLTVAQVRRGAFQLLKDHVRCPGCKQYPEDNSVPAPNHHWPPAVQDMIRNIGEHFSR